MDSAYKPLMVRISPQLRRSIDAVRGDVPRERWIDRELTRLVGDAQPTPARERSTVRKPTRPM